MHAPALLAVLLATATFAQAPGLDRPVMPNSIFEGVAGAPRLRARVAPVEFPASVLPLHGRLDLSGVWRYQADPAELGEALGFGQPDFDDSSWAQMAVPSNYSRVDPTLADYFGPVWFRTRFELPEGFDGRHLVLRFLGVDYFATVFVNGVRPGKNGEHEGYFNPFQFDVGALLHPGTNVLAVRVVNPFDYGQVADGQAAIYPTLAEKVWVKGILNHHDTRPGGNTAGPEMQTVGTGGIVQPVELRADGGVAVRAAFLTPRLSPSLARASVRADVVLENSLGASADVVLVLSARGATFDGPTARHVLTLRVPPGIQRVEDELELEQPRPWYPWDQAALGASDLYAFEARVLQGELELDRFDERFGLRTIGYSEVGPEPFVFRINGARTFLRGSNAIPSQWLGELDRERHERDLDLAIGAGMNALRVHAHVSTPELYEVADEKGVVLFQDMSLQWAYSPCEHERTNGDPALRSNLEVIPRMLAELMYLHYNRPSIVLWMLHNEPLWVFINQAQPAPPALDPPLCAGPYSQSSPQPAGADLSLGSHLDLNLLRPTADAIDPTRAIHTASGFGDTHIYDGWYQKLYTDLADTQGALITEYGAEAAPFRAEVFMPADPLLGPGWYPPDTDAKRHAWRLHDAQLQNFGMYIGRPQHAYEHYADFAFASQLYQAVLLKFATYHWRAERFAPTGTVVFFQLQNWWDSMTWGIFDADGTPYVAYEWAQRFLAPTVFFIDARDNLHRRGDPLEFRFHAVNDTHAPRRVRLRASLWQESDSTLLRGDPLAILDFGIPQDDPTSFTLPVTSLTVTRGRGIGVQELASFAVDQTLVLAPDGQHSFSVPVELPPAIGSRSYTWRLSMEDADSGALVHADWHHFLVTDAPDLLRLIVPPGIHPSPRFDLVVELAGGASATLEVTRVYADELVFAGPVTGATVLPALVPGIYRVRAQAGEASDEELVRLFDSRTVLLFD